MNSFLRFIRRSRFYYMVNVSGLSISIAIMLLAGLFVYRELNTDRFHRNIRNIYCVSLDGRGNTPFSYAEALNERLPGLSSFTRVQLWDLKFNVLRYGSNPPIDLDQIIRADTNFFMFFTFQFISGDPVSCLGRPESLVLTESSAIKLFGNEDALGKTVSYNKGQTLLTVTAIVKDPPYNSSLDFNAVMSVNSLPVIYPPYRLPGAFYWSFETFVTFEGKPDDRTNKLASDIFMQVMPPEAVKEAQDIFKSKFDVRLIPYSKIYYDTGYKTSLRKGDIKQIYLFSIIGLLVFLVALVNYINLSNASATMRTREVLIRKTVGAGLRSLYLQFLGESVFVTFIAVFFALILGNILTQFVNHQHIFTLPLVYFSIKDQLIILICGSILIGISGGIYPAISLASVRTSVADRHKVLSGAVFMRKMLLAFQFLITAGLLICTIVISRQYRCMTNNPVGFDSGNVLFLRMGNQLKKNYRPFVDKLSQMPQIERMANARYGFIGGRNPALQELNCNGRSVKMEAISFTTDTGFMELLGLRISAGNSFRAHDNIAHKLIINEAAFKMTGSGGDPAAIILQDKVHGITWQVVGVVKDFSTRSMQYPVSPFIFYFVPGDADMDGFYMKLRMGKDLAETIDLIKKIAGEFSTEEPVNLEFLDDAKASIYKEDDNRRKIFLFFTMVTILISCLGLYALSGLILERKARETGIRKVYGADDRSIFVMLSSGFIKIVIAGFLPALPLSWFMMNRWLQNFSLKTGLSWWIFLVSGVIILSIAFAAVAIEIKRTAVKNVADIIRYE